MNTALQRFMNDLSTLPLNRRYRCDVYRANDEKLINNEKGHILIHSDSVILHSDDGGDEIVYYPKENTLFCRYVIRDG